MRRHSKPLQIITRRDTLKALWVPAGMVVAPEWLIACAGESGSLPQQPVTSGQAGAQPVSLPPAGATVAGKSGGAGGLGLPGTSGSSGAAAVSGTQPAPAGSAGAGQGAAGNVNAAGAGSAGTGAASPGGAAGASANAGHGGAAGAVGGAQAAAGTGGAVANTSVAWATGGTKAIQGAYPDPFTAGPVGSVSNACKVYPAQTLGPCYAQRPMTRKDISDGLGGLPMRLSFLLVKGDGCTPLPNATIDIWHSGSQGIYSAYAMGTICNPGSENVLSDMFCRGVQQSDANGRCDFDSVFPGWYKGRTIHVHFTVTVNGTKTKTSQVYFEDPLVDEILSQGDYKARGKRDTTNATDSTFKSGGATPEQVLFTTVKRPDGALHAWKVIAVG